MDGVNSFKLALFSFYGLGIIILVLKSFVIIVKAIKSMFGTQQLGIAWYTYVDFIVSALGLATIYFWFDLFFSKQ